MSPKDKKPEDKKNFMDQIREVNRREEQQEQELQQKKILQQEEKQAAWQKKHRERLRQERIEMIKLKQGVEEQPQLISPEPPEKKNYTFKEKWDNYWYHYKRLTFGIGFAVLLAAFFIYDMATTVKPDLNVLFISSAPELSFNRGQLEAALQACSADTNGDGKISVQLIYMPILDQRNDPAMAQQLQIDLARFMAELQSAESMMIFADEEITAETDISSIYEDLSTRFPNDPHVKPYGYYLKDTGFSEVAGITIPLREDTFVAIRKLEPPRSEKKKFQEVYKTASITLDNFIAVINGEKELPPEYYQVVQELEKERAWMQQP